MTETQQAVGTIQDEYGRALEVYLRTNSEAGLHRAYEVGRKAMVNGLGSLDMVGIHQKAIEHYIGDGRPQDEARLILRSASQFLTESLAAFEITHLGFRETLAQMSERTAQLEALNRSLGLEIDQRIRTESALRESQEKFQSLVDNARDVIYTLSLQGVITSLNPAFEEMTGWKREDWVGRPFTDLLDPGDVKREEEIRRLLVKGAQPPLFELRIRQKEGRPMFAEFVTAPLMYGTVVGGVLGLARDVTERRKAEEQIRASQARLTEAQRVAHLGNWEWVEEEENLFWSPELYEILGIDEDAFLPSYRIYFSVVHPDDHWIVKEALGKAIKQREGFDVTHRIIRPDGQVRVIHATGKSVRDKEGNPVRMFGTAQDITEAKIAENALKELPNKILQAQEEERQRLSRELHDDVCQRLSAMRLGIDIMEREAEGNPKVVQKIRSTKEQIDRIIKDVRRMSWNLRPTMLDDLGLGPALQRLCKDLMQDHKAKIRVKLPATIPGPFVGGTDITLYRIAQEALMNSVKHSNATKISIELTQNQERIRLVVADNGMGIETSRPPQPSNGHGLGLQSMKERAGLHHGTLQIISGAGKGTTVIAELPVESGH